MLLGLVRRKAIGDTTSVSFGVYYVEREGSYSLDTFFVALRTHVFVPSMQQSVDVRATLVVALFCKQWI